LSNPEEKMMQQIFGMFDTAIKEMTGDLKLVLKVKPSEAVEITKLLQRMREDHNERK